MPSQDCHPSHRPSSQIVVRTSPCEHLHFYRLETIAIYPKKFQTRERYAACRIDAHDTHGDTYRDEGGSLGASNKLSSCFGRPALAGTPFLPFSIEALSAGSVRRKFCPHLLGEFRAHDQPNEQSP